MNRVVHFSINADDAARAAKFYTKAFGWKIEKWKNPTHKMDYWMVATGEKEPRINGGMMKREKSILLDSHTGYVCTIEIPSIDEYMDRVKLYGGKLTGPKMPLSGVGWIVNCQDTEGNMFSMIQNDKKMK